MDRPECCSLEDDGSGEEPEEGTEGLTVISMLEKACRNGADVPEVYTSACIDGR